MTELPDPGFGLYLHWPFCQAKCPYCDFNSHVSGTVDAARWARAYAAEIERVAGETGRRRVATVFFGGGTPSLMPPWLVDAILREVAAAWDLAGDAEITLEANPTSVEAGRFRELRGAGVNRISLGIQALDDAALRRLGRLHSVRDALAALDIARRTFDQVSFDLIYARENQSLEDWGRELRRALDLGTDHLSLYQLTIEEGTVFARRAAEGRMPGLPDDDRAAQLYERTGELCAAAGLPAYEVSNHARPGAESRHNLIYWRSGDFAGIGPGAHGRLTLGGARIATEAHRDPAAWLRAVETAGSGEAGRTVLTPDEIAAEHLLMGLRLSEGISLARHARLGGSLPPARLARLAEAGLVEWAGDRLRTTARGRLLLNRVVADLLAGPVEA